MNGWSVDPVRLRALQEEAELRAGQMADLIGCHHQHYRKFVIRPPRTPAAQPSAVLCHAIRRVLSERLGRHVSFADFAIAGFPADTGQSAA